MISDFFAAVWTNGVAYPVNSLLEDFPGGPYESTTIIGVGIIVGVAVFVGTGVAEVALIAAATVKIFLPEKGESRSRAAIIEEVVEEII